MSQTPARRRGCPAKSDSHAPSAAAASSRPAAAPSTSRRSGRARADSARQGVAADAETEAKSGPKAAALPAQTGSRRSTRVTASGRSQRAAPPGGHLLADRPNCTADNDMEDRR